MCAAEACRIPKNNLRDLVLPSTLRYRGSVSGDQSGHLPVPVQPSCQPLLLQLYMNKLNGKLQKYLPIYIVSHFNNTLSAPLSLI